MKKLFFAALCSMSVLVSQGQSLAPEVIASAGTFAASAGGSMSWTIGEVTTETYSSAANFFTQGFHQPDTAYVTVVSNPVSQNISIYPNPVVDNLVIDLSGAAGDYTIEVLDMQGQVIRRESISSAQGRSLLSFREFANGIYLVNIVHTASATRTSYKINKAQ